jgi:hypothetical protein
MEKLLAQEQREIKQLKQELWRMEEALAEAAALLVLQKKQDTRSSGETCGYCSEDAEG